MKMIYKVRDNNGYMLEDLDADKLLKSDDWCDKPHGVVKNVIQMTESHVKREIEKSEAIEAEIVEPQEEVKKAVKKVAKKKAAKKSTKKKVKDA